MKDVKFIRHSMPADPYTDYTKLTFEQICDLATEKFTPDIHPDSERIVQEKLEESEMKNVDIIFCSKSKRTKQTAELIKNIFKLDVEIMDIDLLNEIHFDPAKQMSFEEYQEKGLQLIRERLFEGMQTGEGADSVEETLRRIKKLEIFLKELKYSSILCVTHSFYMRFLRIYFLEEIKDFSKITPQKLMETIDHTYIEGFEINFS